MHRNFIEPEQAFEIIATHWKHWAKQNGFSNKKWVLGISGGKDSTIVAGLACKIFGKDSVVGISLPCDGQKDMSDVNQVFDFFGIQRITIDIGDANTSILNGIENNALDISLDTKINLPCRLRMATIYAVAQTVDGIVLNTSNLSEDTVGYATLFGDSCGSYAPIQGLTVTELLELGKWLGIPHNLVYKTPIDGLQIATDEDRLGISYANIDKVIRGCDVPLNFREKVVEKYIRNKFKLEMIRIPGPKFSNLTNTVSEISRIAT